MRFYRLLLHLYPASFRRAYGAELRQAFAERRREAGGASGMLLLWLETLPEVIGNAAAVHWDILRQDLRFARRSLARARGFAVTAIVVTALGVGATAAAFSVSDFVLIKPLPFAQPDRLVNLWERVPGYRELQLSPANYTDWKAMSTSFTGMSAYSEFAANLVSSQEPERVQCAWVTHDLFTTLGVQTVLGRGFSAADDRVGAPGTVVLSYAFWQAVFGGDRGIIGQSLRLDGESYQVIGVMPASFQFPTRSVQLWTPFRFDKAGPDYQDRTNYYLYVVGRLAPGVTVAQARADLEVIASRLEQQYPVANKQTSAAAVLLRDDVSQQSRVLLLTLSGAALCILLIACANLGNLLLVRGVARRRELAVRTALGAGRERLVRQMLTETLFLVGSGWALGIGVGVAAVPLLARLVPNTLPVAGVPAVDVRVLALAGALTLVTSLAFAILPAWRTNRRSGLAALRDGRGAGGGRSERVRALLVTFEVAMSVVLLVSAGLLLRTVARINTVDPGVPHRRSVDPPYGAPLSQIRDRGGARAVLPAGAGRHAGHSGGDECGIRVVAAAGVRRRHLAGADAGRDGDPNVVGLGEHPLRDARILCHDGHCDPRRPRRERPRHTALPVRGGGEPVVRAALLARRLAARQAVHDGVRRARGGGRGGRREGARARPAE